jgi:hypothetical protein
MDARRVVGTDVRRAAVAPEDWARAESLVARHGGSVAFRAIGTDGVAERDATAEAALGRLARTLTA